jgi:hypothetical protein
MFVNDSKAKPPPVPITPGIPPPFPSRGMILSYHRGVWGETPEPCGPDPGGEFTDEMREAGYTLLHVHGLVDASFWLEVFDHLEGGTHIVVMNTSNRFHPILCPDVPSLMGLLAELLPVVEASQRLDEVQERETEKVRRKLRGPNVYDHRRRQMRYARAGE